MAVSSDLLFPSPTLMVYNMNNNIIARQMKNKKRNAERERVCEMKRGRKRKAKSKCNLGTFSLML